MYLCALIYRAYMYGVCLGTRIYRVEFVKNNGINRIFREWIVGILLFVFVPVAYAQTPAGTTMDRATQITEQATYTVQSGSNYISIEPEYLPTTVIYVPGAPFGPLPVAMEMSDTIPAQVMFSYEECLTGWVWTITESDMLKIVEIKAHESALLYVIPTIGLDCPEDTEESVEAWDSYEWGGETYTESGDYPVKVTVEEGCEYTKTLHLTIHKTTYNTTKQTACGSAVISGKTYTESGIYPIDTVILDSGDRQINSMELTIAHETASEITLTECGSYTFPGGKTYTASGDYTETITNVAGCDSVIILHLTIDPDCQTTYETVYFCAGQNTEHDERDGEIVRRYRAYIYESPAKWDYREGMVVSGEQNRTLVDLHRVEQNLYNHYVDELVPVKTIIWTYCPEGELTYRDITPANEPQWIEAGVVSLTVRFVCGQVFTSDFTTDITEIETDVIPAKKIENGQVVILRGGAKYNLLGTKIQ